MKTYKNLQSVLHSTVRRIIKVADVPLAVRTSEVSLLDTVEIVRFSESTEIFAALRYKKSEDKDRCELWNRDRDISEIKNRSLIP